MKNVRETTLSSQSPHLGPASTGLPDCYLPQTPRANREKHKVNNTASPEQGPPGNPIWAWRQLSELKSHARGMREAWFVTAVRFREIRAGPAGPH